MRLEAHVQDRSEAVYLMNKILGIFDEAFINFSCHRRSQGGGKEARPLPPSEMPPMIKIITTKRIFSVQQYMRTTNYY